MSGVWHKDTDRTFILQKETINTKPQPQTIWKIILPVRSTGSWRSSRHHPRCWKEIERETVIHASEAVAARSAVKACTVYIIMSRRSTAGISRQSIFHYNIYNLSSSVQCVWYLQALFLRAVCVYAHTHKHTMHLRLSGCAVPSINVHDPSACCSAWNFRIIANIVLRVVFVILLKASARTQVMNDNKNFFPW